MDSKKGKKQFAMFFILVLLLLICLFATCFPSLSQYRTRIEVGSVSLSVIEHSVSSEDETTSEDAQNEVTSDWTEGIEVAN